MSLWEGSWLSKSGQTGVRLAQRAFITVAGASILWFFARHEIAQLSTISPVMLGMATAATCWAAYSIRCPCCGMPVYAMRLLGLPEVDRGRFEEVSRCPYCLDDGAGSLGDPDRFNRAQETRRAWVFLGKVVLIVVWSFLLLLILARTGVVQLEACKTLEQCEAL